MLMLLLTPVSCKLGLEGVTDVELMALVPYCRLPSIGEVVRGAVSPFVVASEEGEKDRGQGDPGSQKW